MKYVDGSVHSGTPLAAIGQAEILAQQMGEFPAPGSQYGELDPAVDPIADFEQLVAGAAEVLSAPGVNLKDETVKRVGEYFDVLLKQAEGNPVERARLVRAAMILAEPQALHEENAERLKEITLLAAEYATADRGDPVVRTNVYWHMLPGGTDAGMLQGPLSFRIKPSGYRSNGNQGFRFCMEGELTDPIGNSGAGQFRLSIPSETGYGSGYPHIGRRQIQDLVNKTHAELQEKASEEMQDANKRTYLKHAALVLALSRMRGLERGEEHNVLREYFADEQLIHSLKLYDPKNHAVITYLPYGYDHRIHSGYDYKISSLKTQLAMIEAKDAMRQALGLDLTNPADPVTRMSLN